MAGIELDIINCSTVYRLGVPIEVQHAAAANLISFHRERDLFPLIVANCNYSFSVGKSVSMEYDFDHLEKQVEERFIRGRSRLLPWVRFAD
jgi:hypothetical protein